MSADVVRPSQFKPTIGVTDYSNPRDLAATEEVVLEGDKCKLRVKAYSFNPNRITDIGLELRKRDEVLVATQIGQVRAITRVPNQAWVNSAGSSYIADVIVEKLVEQAKMHYSNSDYEWPHEGV